jgi:hypothetical protein
LNDGEVNDAKENIDDLVSDAKVEDHSQEENDETRV